MLPIITYCCRYTTFKDGVSAFVPEAMKPQIVSFISGDTAVSINVLFLCLTFR
jgi:hypothetical protein